MMSDCVIRSRTSSDVCEKCEKGRLGRTCVLKDNGELMNELAKEILSTFGIEITRLKVNNREQVVSLRPNRTPHSTVFLSWLVSPFLLKPGEAMPISHIQYWDCHQIAKAFWDLGYAVDVINSRNRTFRPKKPYSFFIGHRINFDRIVGLLTDECIKIAHLDTAHRVFNDHVTYRRKFDLQRRKDVTIKDGDRLIECNLTIEHADYAVTYGNQFSLDIYRYASTPVFRVPISTCTLFPWPENKDYGSCRSHYLWFGSYGFVHKGLDLVLEAFADMPDYQLYVCGPLEKEKGFVRAFYKELYETPNIHTIGWVDVNGPEFMEIANKCVGTVYASCSESGGASVTTCMHAGLIPLVSYESSVDVDDFGVVFKDNSIVTIQKYCSDGVRPFRRLLIPDGSKGVGGCTNHVYQRNIYGSVQECRLNHYGES